MNLFLDANGFESENNAFDNKRNQISNVTESKTETETDDIVLHNETTKFLDSLEFESNVYEFKAKVTIFSQLNLMIMC